MGDISDFNDVARFLRSPEGKAHLTALRESLVGQQIVEVQFSNGTRRVATEFQLSDGKTFVAHSPSLELDGLRSEFEDVIEREYYVDYPEKKP